MVTRSYALKASTRVPTQITCKLLKSVPAAGARVSAFLHSFYLLTFDASHCCLPSQGARIIAISFNPSTLFFLLPYCPFRVAPRAARGAQYSPDPRSVNALSSSFFGAPFGAPEDEQNGGLSSRFNQAAQGTARTTISARALSWQSGGTPPAGRDRRLR